MASELEHARLLSPSSAKRWRICAPSAVYAANDPKPVEFPHPNSIRGTLMHGVGEDVLRDWWDTGSKVTCDKFLGRELDGQIFSPIEAKETQGWVNYVKKRVEEDPDADLFIEQRLYYNRIVNVPPQDAFGSGDVVITMPNELKLAVLDLKTGKWEVESEYNDQLLIYGMAAERKFSMLAPFNTIETTIYQRGAYPFEVSRDWMNTYRLALRRDVKKIVDAEKIYLKTGRIPVQMHQVGDHCRFCRKVKCEARENSVWSK